MKLTEEILTKEVKKVLKEYKHNNGVYSKNDVAEALPKLKEIQDNLNDIRLGNVPTEYISELFRITGDVGVLIHSLNKLLRNANEIN